MDALAKVGGEFTLTCRNPDGSVAWREKAKNGIPNVGLNHLLATELGAGTQVTAWKIGLINNVGWSALAAADTMSSHAGWSELTGYDEAARPTLAFAAASGQSIATSAAATFTASGSVAIKGAFISSDATKGGTSGTLFATGSFSGVQSLTIGQTLDVSYSCGAASA